MEIYEAQVRDFFAKKPPPSKEMIDPVKAKRTIDALKRPPPPPPDDNHVRALKKTLRDARDSGTTSSVSRTKKWEKNSPARRTGEPIVPPRSRCLAISSQICRGWCPVPILVITCAMTMHILIQWRWKNSDTSMGTLSSK